MRVAAAGKELFRQRDQRDALAYRLVGVWINGARSRRHDAGASEGLLQSDGRRAGEYELMPWLSLSAESLVGGILHQRAAEIGFGSEIARGGKTIEREVVALGAFQGVVTLVANESEARTSHAHGKREERDFAG